MEQKLILIDLESFILNFYNIKIEKNKKIYYLIASTGKIGNKGTTTIIYSGEDYGYCKKEFWKRVNDKKVENYRSLKEVIPEIKNIFSRRENIFVCDLCKKELSERLYKKIDKYLRNETSVDIEKDSPLKNKIACFDCQAKYGVYKGKNNE